MKKIFTFVFILFILVYFFQLYRVAKNYSQSYRFGDEDAHMLAGHLVLKGYKPYKDFSGNHQPVTYLFPAAVEKFWSGNSLFLFVGRHRLAIFLYSIFWQILFFIIFGKFLLFFALLFELCRYVLLGNKMLGEVLAMYPLIFLFGIIIKKIMFNKKLSFLEIILFSASTFLSVFSLLPLWPSISLLNLLLMYSHRKDLRRIITQLLPLFILASLLFFFVPINYYFRDAIYDNLTFVIPKLNKVSSLTDYIRMFFLPFTSFNLRPNFIHILMIFSLFLYAMILNSIKQIKKIVPFLLILLALLLANNRNIIIKFGDFHVLPWLAAFLFIPIVFINYLRKSNKIYVISFILLTIVSVWLNLFNKTDFYGKILLDTKNDVQTENYINYSRSVKYGLAIKTMKHDGDRLFGIANETLVFWVADVDLAIPPLESLPWQYDLPRNRKQLFNLFLNNPPEYFLMDPVAPINTYEPLGNLIVTNLKKNYIQLYHTGKPSELYVLKSRVKILTPSQLSQLKYYLFEVPQTQIN